MKLKICTCFLFAFVVNTSVHGFTDEELQLMKNLRTKCAGETGATDAIIEAVRKGTFDDSNEAIKCYMKCIWVTMTVMDEDGVVDEGVLEVLLPPHLKDSMMAAYGKCKNEGGSSACERAYNINKCIYGVDPTNYFLP